MSFNKNALAFIEASVLEYGNEAQVNRDMIQIIVDKYSVKYPYWMTSNEDYKIRRGWFKIPSAKPNQPAPVNTPEPEVVDMAAQVMAFRQPKLVEESKPTIPEKYDGFVKFGMFDDLKTIIDSKEFYPVFISGLSGNGKTLMVEQVCAVSQRQCIRVNISPETDENDLIGGNTLINGNVMHREGPVLIAMRQGAILLLDEIDRGTNKLMCIQGIMEGKPYYNKKTGEVIHPATGFNIIATANTKGQGSDEGKFLAQILDDAFLERFAITIEQEFPDNKTEKKILTNLIHDKVFVDNLVYWADVVRKSYQEGAIDEVISTRRLVHIGRAFNMFHDRMKAIGLCVNRFDTDTKQALIDLYTKIDAECTQTANTAPESINQAF